MKLLTKSIEASLPRLYETESLGEHALARVKFFTPWSSWTWYATEYDPTDRMFFGKVIGQFTEMGYFLLDQLEEISGPGGLNVERDLWFTPKPLKECE